MNLHDFVNPSTFAGALTIGILAGLISGWLIGFTQGKKAERNAQIKNKGNNNKFYVNNDKK